MLPSADLNQPSNKKCCGGFSYLYFVLLGINLGGIFVLKLKKLLAVITALALAMSMLGTVSFAASTSATTTHVKDSVVSQGITLTNAMTGETETFSYDTSDGNVTILAFVRGDGNCYNSNCTVSSISSQEWFGNDKVNVIVIDCQGYDSDTVSDFIDTYAGTANDDITAYCGGNSLMWKYVSLSGSDTSIYYAFVVCIDSSGYIVAYSDTVTDLSIFSDAVSECLSGSSDDGDEIDDANVQAALAALEEAQAAYDEGSYGFFEWLSEKDGNNAVYYLENATYADYTEKGNSKDATSLANMLATMDFIRECNELRTAVGLNELTITSELMAMAQSNANYSDVNVHQHSKQFSGGENLAWGYSDPFVGWYDNEKAIMYSAIANGSYDGEEINEEIMEILTNVQNNGYVTYSEWMQVIDEYSELSSAIGHYFNIVLNDYEATGFAICTKGAVYNITYSQTFTGSRYSGWLNTTTYTVDEYETLLNEYIGILEANIAEAEDAYETALQEYTIAQVLSEILSNDWTASQEVLDTTYASSGTTAEKLADWVEDELADLNLDSSVTVTFTVDSVTEPVDGTSSSDTGTDGSYTVTFTGTTAKATASDSATSTITAHSAADPVVENNVDPTCEEDGSYDSVVYCSVCGIELSRETVTVDATGHDYQFTEWVWASDYSSATAVFTCANDSSHTVEVDAEVTSTGVAAKCEEDGYMDYVATVTFEGETYTSDAQHVVLEMTGHTAGEPEEIVLVERTCTVDGVSNFVTYCVDCGTELSREENVTVAAGHTWDEGTVTKEAECTEDGEILYTCTVCRETKTETIPALGHDYISEVTTEPKCTETGVMTYTCSRCGDTYTEEIPATGHTWDEGTVITAATCTEDGEMLYTCTECGETKTEAIAATGHSWNDGEVITVGTCTTEGEILYTCTDCGETYTETTTPSGHITVTVIENYIEATAWSLGSYQTVTYCVNCGLELSRIVTIIPATRVDVTELWTTTTTTTTTTDTTTVEETINVSEPIESTDTDEETEGETTSEPESSVETNPTTGIALSLIPMAIAALAAVSAKRR